MTGFKAVVGIDPGITGAIAVLVGDKCAEVHDMPVMPKPSGKGQQVNPYALFDIIEGIHRTYGIELALVERVHAMPKQGVTSVFSFGVSSGCVQGVLAAIRCKTVFPTPHKWKKAAGLIGKEKDQARTLAIQQHPYLAGQLARKKDGGRADAILIAQYGQ